MSSCLLLAPSRTFSDADILTEVQEEKGRERKSQDEAEDNFREMMREGGRHKLQLHTTDLILSEITQLKI